MAGSLSIEWSSAASMHLDNFYNYILNLWSVKEAEKFLDQVQEFENIITKFPNAFISSKRKTRYRNGLIHKHVSAIYEVRKSKIIIVALIDNRSMNKLR